MNTTEKGSPGGLLNRCKTDPLAVFQFIEKIGQGNQSQVYKALNKITDKLVTIKVFPLTSTSPCQEHLEFLTNLEHPFIDRVLDIYTTEEQVWLISEYYQLGSIHDIMKMTKQSLSEAEISCVCYSVLYALDYIHTLNKVHRGVKTSNILVNLLGQVKLTDFDSALWQNNDTTQEKDYEYSTDIWDLGMCVIEMIQGASAFGQQQNKQQKSSLNSRELNDFVKQCLQTDLNKRPKALKLLDHPFISTYKANLPQIRKKFSQERMQKIAEFKKNSIIQLKSLEKKNQAQKALFVNITGEENIPDESDIPNNTVDEIAQRLNNNETDEFTLESENFFVDKPSFNFTDGPSRIEFTARNPNNPNNFLHFDAHEPVSHIKHTKYDDSQDFDFVPDTDQVSIMSSPRLEFTSEKKEPNFRVPPLKFGMTAPLHQGKMPTIDSRFSSENTYTKSKRNREEMFKTTNSVACKSSGNKINTGRPKMYKATNESNFVVKHKISATSVNNPLNYSVDTESTLNPISDRQKIAQAVADSGPGSTVQLVDGLENYMINIPRASAKELKEMTVSTAADSKGSSCFKSVFHTPNPSDSRKSVVLKVVKENIERNEPYNQESLSKREEKTDIEAERLRLEEQMERELTEVRKKYSSMLKGLGK